MRNEEYFDFAVKKTAFLFLNKNAVDCFDYIRIIQRSGLFQPFRDFAIGVRHHLL